MSVIITLLLVVSIAVNVWLLRQARSPKKQSVRSTLIQGIKNVRELTTLRQHFQSVVIFKDSKALFGFSLPGTERKFILKYSGVITCGNDLDNMQITERFAVNCIRMIVPRSKILDCYADMKSVQVYDQSAGIFTSIELNDQNREIANNLEDTRLGAMQGDILRRADDNTRAVLASVAASLGMEAEIIFDDCDTRAAIPAPVGQTPVVVEQTPVTVEPIMMEGTEAVSAKPADSCPPEESAQRESESISEH